LGHGDVAGFAFVAVRSEAWHLNEVEVVKQTNPRDSGKDMQVTEPKVSDCVLIKQRCCGHEISLF
jgi:hypothetical protein